MQVGAVSLTALATDLHWSDGPCGKVDGELARKRGSVTRVGVQHEPVAIHLSSPPGGVSGAADRNRNGRAAHIST